MKGSAQIVTVEERQVSAIQSFTIILGLITATLGLATAYLNFRTAQQIGRRRDRKQRWLPWR